MRHSRVPAKMHWRIIGIWPVEKLKHRPFCAAWLITDREIFCAAGVYFIGVSLIVYVILVSKHNRLLN
jgi:hypothetical protein